MSYKNLNSHCAAPYNSSPQNKDYIVDVVSEVPPELRWNNPHESVPEIAMPKNGGLFSGPEPKPGSGYEAIKVPPTGTYYIHYNLRSANPPPGALEHYCGTNRSSNNYLPMPNVYWLNDGSNRYPADNRYIIKFTKGVPDYNHK
jgi:hypothetical protein